MNLNLFSISGAILCITGFFLTVILVIYGKNRLHHVWALFNVTITIWGIGMFLVAQAKTDAQAIGYWKLAHIGGLFISVTFLHTVCAFCNLNRKKLLVFGYLQAASYLVLDRLNLLSYTVQPLFNNTIRYFKPIGPQYLIYMGIWFSLSVYGFYLLFKLYRHAQGRRKIQTFYFIISLLFGYIGGITHFITVVLLKYNIEFYPFGQVAIAIYAIVATYVTFRYNFMDVKIVLTRAGIFILVYSLVLGMPFWLAGWGREWLTGVFREGWFWVPMFFLFIFATSGPFIYLFFQRRAENILLKEQKAYQKALLEISFTMLSIKDLERLLRTIVLRVVDLVKVSWAGVYFKDTKLGKYTLRYQMAKQPAAEPPKDFALDSALATSLSARKVPLVGEEITGSRFKIGLAVPCFMDEEMAGFLLLGDKPKSSIYTQEDISVFATLANQTALAVENCQFYAQEREHHHLLRVTSLDRQMTDMAHEIDNPNQALLGCLFNLEAAIEGLKDNTSKEEIERLKQALKDKINKARFNAGRISRMIAAVREFSRPSAEKPAFVKLQWILEDFSTIIHPQIKYEGVSLTQDFPKEEIWLKANKVEIEQVLVNLGTNSVQAIKEVAAAGMNAPGWERAINLRAYKTEAGNLRIDFSDTGSGIEKRILEDIFLDFVTTKGSSTGTGLGLAISRKIINKHNGRIWAESEGKYKGAVFHIELPIAQGLTRKDMEKAESERGDKSRSITWNV